MKTLTTVTGLAFLSTLLASDSISSFNPNLNGGQIACQSIDSTHRPFYFLKIFPFDVTHPDYYGVRINKVLDLEGSRSEVINKEGPGEIEENYFKVRLNREGSEEVVGFRARNGFLKARLYLESDNEIELSCKYFKSL